ncbi:MAG: PASTA domain-containing protein [Nitrospirae bacterium]|nr:MAG: PASTA domain-containing protein [Nitrospirota bacterium]
MRRLFSLLLYITVFVSLVGISSFFTFRFLGAQKTVTVPDLTGKSLVEANKLIFQKRLYLKIAGEEFSTEIPSGHIIRQDIPPGNKIKEGRTIRILLSKGPKRNYMPYFIGLTEDEAKRVAREKKIHIKQIIRVHSDSFEKGMVIAQRPTAEERGGDTITLLVSKGAYPVYYRCPDFTEMSLEQAKETADRIGVELELTGYGSKVAGQSPEPGSLIKRGDLVKLNLEYREEQQLKWL